MGAHYFDARRLLELWDSETSFDVIGEVLGCSAGNVRKWQQGRRCSLNAWQADKYAIRAGSHPALVWPEWVDVALSVN